MRILKRKIKSKKIFKTYTVEFVKIFYGMSVSFERFKSNKDDTECPRCWGRRFKSEWTCWREERGYNGAVEKRSRLESMKIEGRGGFTSRIKLTGLKIERDTWTKHTANLHNSLLSKIIHIDKYIQL